MALVGDAGRSGDGKADAPTGREPSLERTRRQIKTLDGRIRHRQQQGADGQPLGGFRKVLDHAQLVCWLIAESVHTVGELLTAVAMSTGVMLYLLTPMVLMFQGKMAISSAAGVMGLSTLGTVGGFALRSSRSPKRRPIKA